MKVLMIDKYYFIKGGAERYFFELKKCLEDQGHQVIPFSMKHEKNERTPYESYFVDKIELNPSSTARRLINGPRILGRVLYSTQARARMEALIKAERPDIAHLHMIDHQISPSILPVLKRYRIPMIQTVHQYKLVCPNYRLYVDWKNALCEKCLSGGYYHAVLEKCHQQSYLSSFLVAFETYWHNALHIYERNIDYFVAPSHFLGSKLVKGGIDPAKIVHMFYAIDVQRYSYHPAHDDYFVYYGRLAAEKGLRTLLLAMKAVKGVHLKVIGEGPLRGELENFARSQQLDSVEFLGSKQGEELNSLVSNAMFVVVPSEWYENSPLVVYESFAMGKPVIGARIGGIPELIEHGVDGLLFEPRNVSDLAAKINQLASQPSLVRRMSFKARKKAENQFGFDNHYPRILALYERCLGRYSKHSSTPYFDGSRRQVYFPAQLSTASV